MIAIIHPDRIDFANEIPVGFKGKFRRNVTLDPPPDDLNDWADGDESPFPVVAESIRDPRHYRVFKHERDVVRSGFVSTGKMFGNLYTMYPGSPNC